MPEKLTREEMIRKLDLLDAEIAVARRCWLETIEAATNLPDEDMLSAEVRADVQRRYADMKVLESFSNNLLGRKMAIDDEGDEDDEWENNIPF